MKTVYENEEDFERSRDSRPLEESQIQHEDSEQHAYNLEDNLETYEENKNENPVQEESNQINTFKTFMNNNNEPQEPNKEKGNNDDIDFERLMNEVNENRYEGELVIEAKPFRPLQYNVNNVPVVTQKVAQVPVEHAKPVPVVHILNKEKPTMIEDRPITEIHQIKTMNTPQPKSINIQMSSSQYSQPTKTYVKITNTNSSNNININRTSPSIMHKRPVEIKRVEVRKNISYSPQVKENKVSLAKGPVPYLKTNVRRRFILSSNIIEDSKSSEYNAQHQRITNIRGDGRRNENVKSSFDENSDYEEPVYYGNRPIKL
jgi:hypothetical protein